MDHFENDMMKCQIHNKANGKFQVDIDLPVFRFFPWHLKKYSVYIFDDNYSLLASISHFVVLVINFLVALFFWNRKKRVKKYK